MTKTAVKHAKKADKKEFPLPPGMTLIEECTERHAANYNALANVMAEAEGKIAAIKAEYAPALRDLVDRYKLTHDALNAHILANPKLFEKPRTRVLHGFKVGFRKLEGKIVFRDEEKSVALAAEHLSDKQWCLVVRVSESINKDAAAQLPAATLKKIGGEITDPVDQVVIQSATGDVTKLVEALIKEAQQ